MTSVIRGRICKLGYGYSRLLAWVLPLLATEAIAVAHKNEISNHI